MATTIHPTKKRPPRAKRETTQSEDRNTITQSMSFSWDVYDVLEAQRTEWGSAHQGRAVPRSEYIAMALIEKWRREGHWPPKAKK